MTELSEETLSTIVCGKSIRENLDQAVRNGVLCRTESGNYKLVGSEEAGKRLILNRPAIQKKGNFENPCTFLKSFLFEGAYAESQVPFGCRDCFKVIIGPRSLRQLMIVKGLAEATAYSTKSAAEALNPRTSRAYVTVMYVNGLPQARQAYREMFARMRDHPGLGRDIPIFIRRGCANYERLCGRSDRYAIDNRLEAVENELETAFEDKLDMVYKKNTRDAASFLRMIHIAFQIGDGTYLDFTNGKSLSPDIVMYSPDSDEVVVGPETGYTGY